MRTFAAAALLLSAAGAVELRDDPPMTLELLPEGLAQETGAQCLDHSPAGYYIREQDPDKWVIFLQGGALCVEPIDCIVRAKSALGSSKYWDPAAPPGPGGTTNPSELNPLAGWSHVWVPYCSGDTWLGNSASAHALLGGLQMSGHLILEILVARLQNTTSFATATDVVISGSSAGGIGTFHHADWLADGLATHASRTGLPAPRVVGFPVEGFFWPERWPVFFAQFAVGDLAPASAVASKYVALLERPWFPPACVKASEEEGFDVAQCFDISRMISYVKTPLFIAMNLFDEFIIKLMGLCALCSADSGSDTTRGQYIRYYGNKTLQTIADVTKNQPQMGWFSPSEFHHDENFYRFFYDTEKSINSVTLRDSFNSWYHDKKQVVLVEETCNNDGPCASPVSLDEGVDGPVV